MDLGYDDIGALDDLLDELRAATKVRPADWPRIAACKAALRDFNGVDTVGVLTADVYLVARRRLAQGYSLAEVAAMTGLSRGTLGDIRSGRRKARKLGIRTPRAVPQIPAGL